MTITSMLLIGFFLGLRHALESDHLAAVATLATGQQSLLSTIRQGVAWGIGHTVTLLFVGGVVLALGARIPEQLEQSLELCVGVMLIGLGADVMRKLRRQRVHFHVHRHGNGELHVHAHSHAEPKFRAPLLPTMPPHVRKLPMLELPHAMTQHAHHHMRELPVRAMAVGMMHGLAGSAALVVLSLQSVRSVPAGLGYIGLFGLGSIVGMALLSAVIAIPLRWSGRYLTGLYRTLAAGIGLLTVGLGAWIVVSIGFIDGLLLAAPL